MRLAGALVVTWLASAPVLAQESQLQANFRKEREHIGESCSGWQPKGLAGCVVELATDEPLHVAAGSLPPQNGLGLGGAFVTHYTPNESWRLSWNADAVANRGAWRAGAYMKIIWTNVGQVGVESGGSSAGRRGAMDEYLVINLYGQAISMDKLFFFGLGPNSTTAGKSVFGMRETIAGGDVVVPLKAATLDSFRAAFVGGVAGRFVSLKTGVSDVSPSIDTLYNNSTAPGLDAQPAFTQLSAGLRLRPTWFGAYVQPDYLVDFDQFLASGNGSSSFHRWTIDVAHQIPLYGTSRPALSRPTNGPDECRISPASDRCPPPVSLSRNLTGSFGIRLLVTGSAASSGDVPFYFQPTLGGSDINGDQRLASYDDYRFRGPNMLVLQESFEHSIGKLPVGFEFLADQGKVALASGDINFQDLSHSFAAGATLRAGGFPQVSVLFGWGGTEGHRIVAIMNSTLLGGSSRPPLQ